MKRPFFIAVALSTLLVASQSSAACVNKFVVRSEGSKRFITLLTGTLTFPEANELAKAILKNQAKPIEWVDASGKTIAKQIGELKVVQPMPVSCGDKKSGVVLNVTFLAVTPPSGTMLVKLAEQTVQFDQQK